MFFLVYSATYIEFVILEALASKERAGTLTVVPWLNNEVCGILGNIDHVIATDVLGIRMCLLNEHMRIKILFLIVRF